MGNVVYKIGDARRELPRIVRDVAAGRGPVAIGPRGEAVAVIVAARDYAALQARSASSGWGDLELEIVGSPEDLEVDVRRARRAASKAVGARAARGEAARPRR